MSVLERGGREAPRAGSGTTASWGDARGAPGPYAAAVGPEGTSAGDGTEGDAADSPSGNADGPVRGRPLRGGRPRVRRGREAAAARRGGDARPPSVRKNVKNDKSDRSGTATAASDQTLLKKLFAKEVRVDRARLLQVFRFLAANDFLRAETRLDALWVFPWADDPERDPQREKQRLRKLALEAAEAQEEEEEEETKR